MKTGNVEWTPAEYSVFIDGCKFFASESKDIMLTRTAKLLENKTFEDVKHLHQELVKIYIFSILFILKVILVSLISFLFYRFEKNIGMSHNQS